MLTGVAAVRDIRLKLSNPLSTSKQMARGIAGRGRSSMVVPHSPATLLVTSTETLDRADNSMAVPHPPATLLVTSTETLDRADS